MRKIVLAFLVATVILSCQNKTSDKTEQPKVIVENKPAKKLVFEIELETTEPDEFTLFSSDVFLNNNQFMDISVNQKLLANETQKTIKAEFPEGVVPDYNLGFILGKNKEKEVTIKKIILSFGEQKISIAPNQILKYFVFNKFAEYNPDTEIVKTLKVNGKHNPVMLLKKKFLSNLTK